jgi:hypothetical protein
MIEEIVSRGNIVEEASNRFRTEQIGSHLEEKRTHGWQGDKEVRRVLAPLISSPPHATQ